MDDIQAVLARLDDVITWARAEQHAAGYFAALYRTVTQHVAHGIRTGLFEDGPAMERLDVVFASRYLDAFEGYRSGAPITRAWTAAFDYCERWHPIVLQHLIGGINAHINLDLGIAVAAVARDGELERLRGDFLKINALLAGLVQGTKENLSRIWPPLRLLDWLSGNSDDEIIKFSLSTARDGAWQFAQCLTEAPSEQRQGLIAARDEVIGTHIAGLVYRPGLLLRAALLRIRIAERGSVTEKIDILASATPKPSLGTVGASAA